MPRAYVKSVKALKPLPEIGLIFYISMSLKLSCKGLYKNLVNKVIAAENT